MDINFNDVKVGDKVWYVIKSHYEDLPGEEREVVKVGREYFYIKDRISSTRIKKSNGVVSDSYEWRPSKCYHSKQEYDELVAIKKEIAKLQDELKAKSCNLSLDQLRRILAIVNE